MPQVTYFTAYENALLRVVILEKCQALQELSKHDKRNKPFHDKVINELMEIYAKLEKAS